MPFHPFQDRFKHMEYCLANLPFRKLFNAQLRVVICVKVSKHILSLFISSMRQETHLQNKYSKACMQQRINQATTIQQRDSWS